MYGTNAYASQVQIHGALKNDFGPKPEAMYKTLCADQLGLRWVGYAARSFRPVVTDWERARRAGAGRTEVDREGHLLPWWGYEHLEGESTSEIAHIDSRAFGQFVRRITRHEWGVLDAAWAEEMRRLPDPRLVKKLLGEQHAAREQSANVTHPTS